MADILIPNAQVINLVHYPSSIAGITDFNQSANPSAKGNFLNAANPGDGSAYDFIDVSGSLKKAATKMTVFVEGGASDSEILVKLNARQLQPKRRLWNPRRDMSKENPRKFGPNTGMEDNGQGRLMRILVPAGTAVVFEITDTPIQNLNIDYNGSAGSVGDILQLVLTIH